MGELSTTAAYILTHRDTAPAGDDRSSLDEVLKRLLETPHTVKSLTKAVAHEDVANAGVDENHIRARLQVWLDNGTIELSPDS